MSSSLFMRARTSGFDLIVLAVFCLTDLLTVLALGFAGLSLRSPVEVADWATGLPPPVAAWEAVADAVAPLGDSYIDFSMKKAFLSTDRVFDRSYS